MADTDQWDHMFDTMITITVGTDMMGHVRVTGVNEETGARVHQELEVQGDDPHECTQRVGDAVRVVFKSLDTY